MFFQVLYLQSHKITKARTNVKQDLHVFQLIVRNSTLVLSEDAQFFIFPKALVPSPQTYMICSLFEKSWIKESSPDFIYKFQKAPISRLLFSNWTFLWWYSLQLGSSCNRVNSPERSQEQQWKLLKVPMKKVALLQMQPALGTQLPRATAAQMPVLDIYSLLLPLPAVISFQIFFL